MPLARWQGLTSTARVEAFLSAELSAQVADLASKSARVQKSLRKKLREAVWAHYKDCISLEMARNNRLDDFAKAQRKQKEAGRPPLKKPVLAFPERHSHIGMEAFHDPSGTAAKLQAHFRTHWMVKRQIFK